MPIFLVDLGLPPLDPTGTKLVPFGSITATEIIDLGAFAAPVARAEIAVALQTGVVDAIAVNSAADRDAALALLGTGSFALRLAIVTAPTSGADDLVGTPGDDVISLLGGRDSFDGLAGDDTVRGGNGSDSILGGKGADLLFGGGGNDRLNGGSGNDRLFGAAGNDRLFGSAGRDVIKAGAGRDRLDGGTGADELTGGTGADVFVFETSGRANRDVITDFQKGLDEIHVDSADYVMRVVNGNVVLRFDSGDTLTLEGVTRKAGIDARITVTGAQPPAETNPFLIYDLGGKFDASFNQSASEGAQAWSAATGDSYGEFEIQSESQREQALDRAAASSANYAPIVTIGFGFVDALDVVAPDYPDRSFAIIDAVVNQPNVSSVVFAEYEAAYVMGVVAVLASETDTVGFVGGIDIPFIRQFSTAFEQGVLDTDPDARVIVSMAGTTPAALNDPVRGGELANAQMAQGADVIYAVAAGTGLGVFQAVADAGRLAIGTYSNVQDFFPGTMLTTMEKHVDVAVEHVFGAGADLQPGLIELGLADGALGYGYGDFNRTLLTQDMRDAADAAIADIIAGRIVVEDYLDFGL